MTRKSGIIMMILTATLWSLGGLFIKLISWNPFFLAGMRSLIAGIIVFIYMKYKKFNLNFTKEAFLIGIFTAGTMLSFVIATKLTTSANAIAIQDVAPVFVLLYSILFLHKKAQKMEVVVVIFTFLGIVLFFFDSLDRGHMIGNIVAIISGICFSGMFIANSNVKDPSIKMSGLILTHLFVFVIGVPTGLIIGIPDTSINDIIWILILGVFQLGLSYILCSYATSIISPLSCSLLGMVEPILNPIWVAIFYGEVPGMWALIGASIVIVTIIIYNIWDSKREILNS